MSSSPSKAVTSGYAQCCEPEFRPGCLTLNTLTIDSQSVLALPRHPFDQHVQRQPTRLARTHDLVIDIVAAGLLGPNALTSLLSTFSVSGLPRPGGSIQEQTFIDNNPLADTGVFTGVSRHCVGHYQCRAR